MTMTMTRLKGEALVEVITPSVQFTHSSCETLQLPPPPHPHIQLHRRPRHSSQLIYTYVNMFKYTSQIHKYTERLYRSDTCGPKRPGCLPSISALSTRRPTIPCRPPSQHSSHPPLNRPPSLLALPWNYSFQIAQAPTHPLSTEHSSPTTHQIVRLIIPKIAHVPFQNYPFSGLYTFGMFTLHSIAPLTSI